MLKAAVCVVLLILTPLLSVLSGATAQLDLTSERVKGVYCDRRASSALYKWLTPTPTKRTAAFVHRPPHSQHAAMARYTVHRNTWGSVATFSQHLSGFPFS